MHYRTVAVACIRVSEKQRRKVCWSKVEKHRVALEQGEDVYPIDVHQTTDGVYTIAGNGRHRFFACLEAGEQYVSVNVLNG